jgi:hypothetical protein
VAEIVDGELFVSPRPGSRQGPYPSLLLGCYTIPTLQIHATLASAFSREGPGTGEERDVRDAELSLILATLVLIAVLQSQSALFSLGLEEELQARWDEVTTVWKDRPHGPLAKRAEAQPDGRNEHGSAQ